MYFEIFSWKTKLVVILLYFVSGTNTKKFIHNQQESDFFSTSRLHQTESVRDRRSVQTKLVRRSVVQDDPNTVNANPDEGHCRNPLEDDKDKQITTRTVSSLPIVFLHRKTT